MTDFSNYMGLKPQATKAMASKDDARNVDLRGKREAPEAKPAPVPAKAREVKAVPTHSEYFRERATEKATGYRERFPELAELSAAEIERRTIIADRKLREAWQAWKPLKEADKKSREANPKAEESAECKRARLDYVGYSDVYFALRWEHAFRQAQGC